eukprot:3841828-Rhodomonas_salina.1
MPARCACHSLAVTGKLLIDIHVNNGHSLRACPHTPPPLDSLTVFRLIATRVEVRLPAVRVITRFRNDREDSNAKQTRIYRTDLVAG